MRDGQGSGQFGILFSPRFSLHALLLLLLLRVFSTSERGDPNPRHSSCRVATALRAIFEISLVPNSIDWNGYIRIISFEIVPKIELETFFSLYFR